MKVKLERKLGTTTGEMSDWVLAGYQFVERYLTKLGPAEVRLGYECNTTLGRLVNTDFHTMIKKHESLNIKNNVV